MYARSRLEKVSGKEKSYLIWNDYLDASWYLDTDYVSPALAFEMLQHLYSTFQFYITDLDHIYPFLIENRWKHIEGFDPLDMIRNIEVMVPPGKHPSNTVVEKLSFLHVLTQKRIKITIDLRAEYLETLNIKELPKEILSKLIAYEIPLYHHGIHGGKLKYYWGESWRGIVAEAQFIPLLSDLVPLLEELQYKGHVVTPKDSSSGYSYSHASGSRIPGWEWTPEPGQLSVVTVQAVRESCYCIS
jgi:hypothetical protein